MKKYIINSAGAKIYKNIDEHQFLYVPTLKSAEEGWITYEVLSVGSLGIEGNSIITIKEEDGSIIAHRLPSDLEGWVEQLKIMSMNGVKVLPAKVMFGSVDNRTFAEIL